MRGQEHRSALIGQLPQETPDPQDAVGIQAIDRLVQHDRLRIGQQRRCDPEPLPHAQRERSRGFTGSVGQAHEIQQVIHSGRPDTHRGTQRQQVIACRAALVHRLCLQQRPQFGHGRGRVCVRPAVDKRLPGGGPVQTEDHPHRGGLARPVRPQKACDAARLDREADAVDRDDIAVLLGQFPDFQHVCSSLWGVIPLSRGRPRRVVVQSQALGTTAPVVGPRRHA